MLRFLNGIANSSKSAPAPPPMRADVVRDNRLRQGVDGFAARVAAVIDQLDPTQLQDLLRRSSKTSRSAGWHVKSGCASR